MTLTSLGCPLWAVWGVLISLLTSAGRAGPEPWALRFPDLVAAGAWDFYDGAEFPGARGSIAWNPQEGHEAPGCLELFYDFTGGGKYVSASVVLPEKNRFRSVRFRLNKPGPHPITVRVTDCHGQTFQKGVYYHYLGWQQLAVDLTTWTYSWGGPGDGQVRFPLVRFGLLVENTAEPRTGSVLLDDVEFSELMAEAGAEGDVLCTHLASDFQGPPRWHAEGGEGNRLNDGVWTFHQGEGRRPALRSSFSFLGRPQKLRLVLESETAGPELILELASHYQTFYRSLGRLEGRGGQVLEVPLGDMAGWKYRGGHNDGLLRLPLRMQGILLDAGEGVASGTIRLLRLEVDTRIPAARTTLLIPDVVRSGDHARFSVRASNLRHQPWSGRLWCEVRGLTARVRHQEFELTLGPQEHPGSTAERTVEVPFGEHHVLEATWGWRSEDGTGEPVSIGIATVPERPAEVRLDPSSPLGMGMYHYRWRGNPAGPARMAELCDLAVRAGVKWTREEFNWNAIEPARGQIDFTFYDRIIDQHLAHGISVYGLLCYWSVWTRPCTPEGIEDYCRFVRACVRHFKDRIRHWEIWNEPNIFFWTCPQEMYAQLLAAAYAAIKEEDPQAVVLGCSTSGIDIRFIEKTIQGGGRFDALSIHPYRGVLNDLFYIEELRGLHRRVEGEPIWLTEIGFCTEMFKGYSERMQASLLARIYLTSLASGVVANVSWYDFRNDGDDPFEAEHNFGVVRHDLRPKPAYRTLATFCRTMAGLACTGPVDVGPGAYAFRFTGADREVIAACAPTEGRLLAFQSRQVRRALNSVGESIPLGGGGPHTVTLDAGFPVYLEGTREMDFQILPVEVGVTASRLTVHSGDEVELRVRPAGQAVSWDVPAGWDPPVVGGEPDVYVLRVPDGVVRSTVSLHALIGGLRIPVSLLIEPAVVRF